jgi:hypothetical protein
MILRRKIKRTRNKISSRQPTKSLYPKARVRLLRAHLMMTLMIQTKMTKRKSKLSVKRDPELHQVLQTNLATNKPRPTNQRSSQQRKLSQVMTHLTLKKRSSQSEKDPSPRRLSQLKRQPRIPAVMKNHLKKMLKSLHLREERKLNQLRKLLQPRKPLIVMIQMKILMKTVKMKHQRNP